MIKCPFCGTMNVPNTLFCGECGTYLLEDDRRATDLIANEENDVTESVMLAKDASELELVDDLDEIEIIPIEDEELKGLEAIVLGDMEDSDQKSPSN